MKVSRILKSIYLTHIGDVVQNGKWFCKLKKTDLSLSEHNVFGSKCTLKCNEGFAVISDGEHRRCRLKLNWIFFSLTFFSDLQRKLVNCPGQVEFDIVDCLKKIVVYLRRSEKREKLFIDKSLINLRRSSVSMSSSTSKWMPNDFRSFGTGEEPEPIEKQRKIFLSNSFSPSRKVQHGRISSHLYNTT